MRYPNMLKKLCFIFILLAGILPAFSQDTLPKFTVKNRFGKVILSWVNPFPNAVIMNIQRSTDSLKGFKTILSLPDPKAVTNGFLDHKAPNTTQFYKIFVQLEGGKYFFTTAQQPVVDSSRTVAAAIPSNPYQMAQNSNGKIKFSNGKYSDDSSKLIASPLKDIFVPSAFVHTNEQGHVMIVLPEDKTNSYTIKFFKDDGTPLFTMNKVKESQLILDKTNFFKAGWYRFELYENGVLKEKHKFQIPKDN